MGLTDDESWMPSCQIRPDSRADKTGSSSRVLSSTNITGEPWLPVLDTYGLFRQYAFSELVRLCFLPSDDCLKYTFHSFSSVKCMISLTLWYFLVISNVFSVWYVCVCPDIRSDFFYNYYNFIRTNKFREFSEAWQICQCIVTSTLLGKSYYHLQVKEIKRVLKGWPCRKLTRLLLDENLRLTRIEAHISHICQKIQNL